MEYASYFFEDLNINIHTASFKNEYYISAEIAGNGCNGSSDCRYAEAQKNALDTALLKTLPKGATLVWKRYFVSDISNQKHLFDNNVFSVVQQPPLNGSKISVLAYFISAQNSYKHLFTGGMFCREGNTFEQTTSIFNNYAGQLQQHGLSLAGNVIRTWIYVQDIDNHYGDMVSARNYIFAQKGLVEHSIASTGIEGRGVHSGVHVTMDAYAADVNPEQITFLKAETHLNPTCEYGVLFERATAVDYADRRHIFVSGTASIDNRGEIIAPFDIKRQLTRTLENIDALLKEGNAAMKDIAHFIIYLRDSGDYSFVKNYFDSNFADTPRIIVHAPVCRSGWLIEIECIAIAGQTTSNPAWNNFFTHYA